MHGWNHLPVKLIGRFVVELVVLVVELVVLLLSETLTPAPTATHRDAQRIWLGVKVVF